MIAVEWAEKISANRVDLIGIPYSTLDCQAFVEFCLKKYAGISKNWRGSNDMWRNAVHDKSDNFDNIDVGEWVFTIKHDGNEPKRYTDGVNASHVGIYIGNGEVIHSTTGGVQMDKINNSKRWTHHAKANCLYYASEVVNTPSPDENELYSNLYGELVTLVNKYGGNKNECI